MFLVPNNVCCVAYEAVLSNIPAFAFEGDRLLPSSRLNAASVDLLMVALMVARTQSVKRTQANGSRKLAYTEHKIQRCVVHMNKKQTTPQVGSI